MQIDLGVGVYDPTGVLNQVDQTPDCLAGSGPLQPGQQYCTPPILSSGGDVSCVVGGIDPLTGDTIASCGGFGTQVIPNAPQCWPGDALTFQNGYWICGTPVNPNHIEPGGVLSGMPGWAIAAAATLAMVAIAGGGRR